MTPNHKSLMSFVYSHLKKAPKNKNKKKTLELKQIFMDFIQIKQEKNKKLSLSLLENYGIN